MAVHLPSDLIVDVMRHADPSRRSAAVARLQSFGEDTAFASAVEGVAKGAAPQAGDAANEASPALSSSPGKVRHVAGGAEAYQGFEHMVLRNLFESLLPDEKSGAFGGGPSAGVWRSMAADQLAGVYAAGGGVGIAKLLASGSEKAAPRPAAQWPYFALNSISTIGSRG